MPKHKPQTATLEEIINAKPANDLDTWYEMMGIEIPGVLDALAKDDLDTVDRLEREYVKAHAKDRYEVRWPEHVSTPRINSDASYLPL